MKRQDFKQILLTLVMAGTLFVMLSGCSKKVSFSLPETGGTLQYYIHTGNIHYGSLVEDSYGDIYRHLKSWIEHNQEGWKTVWMTLIDSIISEISITNDTFRLTIIQETVYLSVDNQHYHKTIAPSEYSFFIDYAKKMSHEILTDK